MIAAPDGCVYIALESPKERCYFILQTACESGHYEIAAEAFKKSSEVLTAINPSGNVGEIDAAREEVEIKRKVVDYFLDVKK